jgi:hypothetical protein
MCLGQPKGDPSIRQRRVQITLRSHEKKAISRFRGMDQKEVLMLTMLFFLALGNQSVEPSFCYLTDANFARSSETRAWFSGMPITIDTFPKKDVQLSIVKNYARNHAQYVWPHLIRDYHSVGTSPSEEPLVLFREFLSIKPDQKRTGPTEEEFKYLNGCASMLYFGSSH